MWWLLFCRVAKWWFIQKHPPAHPSPPVVALYYLCTVLLCTVYRKQLHKCELYCIYSLIALLYTVFLEWLIKEICQKCNRKGWERVRQCNFPTKVSTLSHTLHVNIRLSLWFHLILLKNSSLTIILFWHCFKYTHLCPEISPLLFLFLNTYFRD